MRWKQRFKCKLCGHVFQNASRQRKIEVNKLWNEYCFWKQNYSELAEKYKVTIKTIQKKLDEYEFISPFAMPTEIILLMDTTYFWEFWVMVFKDYKSKKVINYILRLNVKNVCYF